MRTTKENVLWENFEKADKMIQFADMLMIGGTSLEVGSAAGLAHIFHGKNLVIINKAKQRWKEKQT